MLSAAILLAPGCERRPRAAGTRSDGAGAARGLSRDVLARELLEHLPGRGRRPRARRARYEELRRLAAQSGAGHAVGLGENDVGRGDAGLAPGERLRARAMRRARAALRRL